MCKLTLYLGHVQWPIRLELMTAIMGLAMSSVSLACMYLINTLIPTSFSSEKCLLSYWIITENGLPPDSMTCPQGKEDWWPLFWDGLNHWLDFQEQIKGNDYLSLCSERKTQHACYEGWKLFREKSDLAFLGFWTLHFGQCRAVKGC